MQSKFNLDTRLKIYSFLSSKLSCTLDDITSSFFFFLHVCTPILYLELEDRTESTIDKLNKLCI